MSVHITQIGKHKFICGLFWQSLSRPRELLKEAAELAKKIDSDLMILRRDQATAQAGFAHTRDGARRNYYSLGAAISKSVALNGILYDGHKQTAHNWLGAFKLPDGMWAYFAVRDANFLPNGDFAGTKDEVLDRLHGDYGLGGWNVVLGDPELEEQGFHNFNPFRIEELLPHKKDGQIKTHSWWKMQPARITIPWAPIAVVAAGAAIIGISGLITWKYYQKKIQEEAIVRAKEIARLEQLGKPLPNAFPHPWPTLPAPAQFATECQNKLQHLAPGGWLLDDFVCTPTNITYTWSRQGSTINFLLEQVPNANIDINGNKATFIELTKQISSNDESLVSFKNSVEPSLKITTDWHHAAYNQNTTTASSI